MTSRLLKKRQITQSSTSKPKANASLWSRLAVCGLPFCAATLLVASIGQGAENSSSGQKLRWRPTRPATATTAEPQTAFADSANRQAAFDSSSQQIVVRRKAGQMQHGDFVFQDRQVQTVAGSVPANRQSRVIRTEYQPPSVNDPFAEDLNATPQPGPAVDPLAIPDPAPSTPAPPSLPITPAAPLDAVPESAPERAPAAPYRDEGLEERMVDPKPLVPLDEAEERPQVECDKLRDLMLKDRLGRVNGARIVDLRPQEKGEMPYECTLGGGDRDLSAGRDWACTTYTWKASALCNKPLYFENYQMERYGHSFGPVIDPVVASAHFFGSALILPYKMGVETPCECVYDLGYYRPGSCAPHTIDGFPISVRGAALQAGVVGGLIWVLP